MPKDTPAVDKYTTLCFDRSVHLFLINFAWDKQGIKVSRDLIWIAIWISCASAGGIIGMRLERP